FAPQAPQDLSLFLPEWMIFPLPVLRTCLIIGELDRRIGQRRDATRAPIQARNGWRPSGRLLVTPPHHLSDGQNLSNLWGPPQLSDPSHLAKYPEMEEHFNRSREVFYH